MNLEARQSGINGVGCYTTVAVKRRQKIGVYAGATVRGKRRVARLIREQERLGIIKVIQLNDEIAIDGAIGGDATAHINHSCAPNAFMRVVPGNRVYFFALRDIHAGEEITMNYRDPDHPAPGACRCGAATCRSLKARST